MMADSQWKTLSWANQQWPMALSVTPPPFIFSILQMEICFAHTPATLPKLSLTWPVATSNGLTALMLSYCIPDCFVIRKGDPVPLCSALFHPVP